MKNKKATINKHAADNTVASKSCVEPFETQAMQLLKTRYKERRKKLVALQYLVEKELRVLSPDEIQEDLRCLVEPPTPMEELAEYFLPMADTERVKMLESKIKSALEHLANSDSHWHERVIFATEYVHDAARLLSLWVMERIIFQCGDSGAQEFHRGLHSK